MCRYNPKIDLVFRKLFGSEENKDILISLVNGILNREPQIKDLIIKNPYNFASYTGERNSIIDIKAQDEKGVWYDIEMQIGEQGFYGKRALYYLSKMFVDQLEESESYSKLNETIGIHLLDFGYFYDDRYIRHYVYKDEETNELAENLRYQHLYFIELSKFDKAWEQIKTLLDRWIAFLNKAHELNKNNMPRQLAECKEVVKAVDRLEVINFTKEEQALYEAERKKRLDAAEELRTAREKGNLEGLEEGKALGLKKGKALGIKEGKALGLEEGKALGLEEGKALGLRETRKKLVELGMDEKKIKEILGF